MTVHWFELYNENNQYTKKSEIMELSNGNGHEPLTGIIDVDSVVVPFESLISSSRLTALKERDLGD